jgi:hypothetical protein
MLSGVAFDVLEVPTNFIVIILTRPATSILQMRAHIDAKYGHP